MLLTKEQILAAQDITFEEVEVSEWGGIIRMKSLTGAERDKYESEIVKMKGNETSIVLKDLKVKLLALCIVDGEGNRIFTDGELSLLGGKNAKVINQLFEKAQSLCGLGNKDVEELTKN